MYQPISHSRDCLKEVLVTPCLPFEYEEGLVGLFADLIFKDVVRQDALAGYTVTQEVDGILRWCETAAGVRNVVGYVVFGV